MVEVQINGITTKLRVDSGCQKILLPEAISQHIKDTTKLVKTEIKLHPYGTTIYFKLRGKAIVILQDAQGGTIETFVCII